MCQIPKKKKKIGTKRSFKGEQQSRLKSLKQVLLLDKSGIIPPSILRLSQMGEKHYFMWIFLLDDIRFSPLIFQYLCGQRRN